MVTLSDKALQEIQEHFAEASCIRLDISPRGCGAPVATVEACACPLPSDSIFEVGLQTLCVDTQICNKTESIVLDCCNGRFTVTLGVPVTVDGCGFCPASPLQGGRCGIIDGMNF